jgi:hypothetical protein
VSVRIYTTRTQRILRRPLGWLYSGDTGQGGDTLPWRHAPVRVDVIPEREGSSIPLAPALAIRGGFGGVATPWWHPPPAPAAVEQVVGESKRLHTAGLIAGGYGGDFAPWRQKPVPFAPLPEAPGGAVPGQPAFFRLGGYGGDFRPWAPPWRAPEALTEVVGFSPRAAQPVFMLQGYGGDHLPWKLRIAQPEPLVIDPGASRAWRTFLAVGGDLVWRRVLAPEVTLEVLGSSRMSPPIYRLRGGDLAWMIQRAWEPPSVQEIPRPAVPLFFRLRSGDLGSMAWRGRSLGQPPEIFFVEPAPGRIVAAPMLFVRQGDLSWRTWRGDEALLVEVVRSLGLLPLGLMGTSYASNWPPQAAPDAITRRPTITDFHNFSQN